MCPLCGAELKKDTEVEPDPCSMTSEFGGGSINPKGLAVRSVLICLRCGYLERE